MPNVIEADTAPRAYGNAWRQSRFLTARKSPKRLQEHLDALYHEIDVYVVDGQDRHLHQARVEAIEALIATNNSTVVIILAGIIEDIATTVKWHMERS